MQAPQHRSRSEARDWIVRLNSGRVGADDLARFKAWRDASDLNRAAFAEERLFWQQLHVLNPETVAGPQARMGRRRLLAGAGALAALAAGTVALPPLALAMRADALTGVGETAELTLPDGARAALNTDSALALDFGPGRRLVTLLKGEAEFRSIAVPDIPLRIVAADGACLAQEGRFSVRQVDGSVTVSVAEGRVQVAPHGPTAALTVQAGSQVRYGGSDPALAPQPIDTDVAFAWRSGRIILEGRPFADALHELGRYLPERIVIAPQVDGSIPVSGIFRTHEALAAVNALARTQGRHARRLPGVMILIV